MARSPQAVGVTLSHTAVGRLVGAAERAQGGSPGAVGSLGGRGLTAEDVVAASLAARRVQAQLRGLVRMRGSKLLAVDLVRLVDELCGVVAVAFGDLGGAQVKK